MNMTYQQVEGWSYIDFTPYSLETLVFRAKDFSTVERSRFVLTKKNESGNVIASIGNCNVNISECEDVPSNKPFSAYVELFRSVPSLGQAVRLGTQGAPSIIAVYKSDLKMESVLSSHYSKVLSGIRESGRNDIATLVDLVSYLESVNNPEIVLPHGSHDPAVWDYVEFHPEFDEVFAYVLDDNNIRQVHLVYDKTSVDSPVKVTQRELIHFDCTVRGFYQMLKEGLKEKRTSSQQFRDSIICVFDGNATLERVGAEHMHYILLAK